jgi:hypothetical protein
MRALLSLTTLAAIALIYIVGLNLYLQDNLFFAYSFVLTAIVSLTFWIKANDFFQIEKKA